MSQAVAAAVAAVRAVIYARVSLDKTGDGRAVDRYVANCHRIARERGWLIVGTYIDNSISSDGRKRRAEYDRMATDYAAGLYNGLLCEDLDRLTRVPRELEDWVDAAEHRGLHLVTANGEADLTTDAGRLFARIKIAVARAEVERKGARQKLAAAQRADKGEAPLGRAPYGYAKDGEVDPDEAAIVKEMFKRFAANESLRGVTEWLNAERIPTRTGVPWARSTVARILRNPRYAARAVYRGAETGKAGTWDALVSDEVFDRVQSILATPGRKTQKIGTHRRRLGSGLFRCACGSTVQANGSDRYVCTGCRMTRSGGPIDDLVLAVVRARLGRDDLADLLPSRDAGKARALSDDLGRLRAALATAEEEYDSGLVDGRRYAARAERIRAEMAEVQGEMSRLTATSASTGAVLHADDPVRAFDDAPLMIRRAVIDALCTVVVHPVARGRRGFAPESVTITPREV